MLPSTYFRFERPARSQPSRSSRLERALACAGIPSAVVDWRRDAQRLVGVTEAEIQSAAPAAFLAKFGPAADVRAGHVFAAAPLHTVASMTSVSLPPGGVLTLTVAEAQELAADFNARLRSSTFRMFAGSGGELFCTFDAALNVETHEPDLVQGHDLWDYQPAGPDAVRLKKLGSEIEMFLHDHPLNQRRIERGEPDVTALWLWGGGPVAGQLPPPGFAFSGTDMLFSSWAAVAAGSTSASAQTAGHIVRCPGEPGEPRFENFVPVLLEEAIRSLQRGRIEALHLSAGMRRFSVRRMPRWSLRRTRPWWEYFDETGRDDDNDTQP